MKEEGLNEIFKKGLKDQIDKQGCQPKKIEVRIKLWATKDF